MDHDSKTPKSSEQQRADNKASEEVCLENPLFKLTVKGTTARTFALTFLILLWITLVIILLVLLPKYRFHIKDILHESVALQYIYDSNMDCARNPDCLIHR